MIELRDASVKAPTADGESTILHPTSLTLTERRIAVIGANGSGKSTLARLFNGLVLPSTGSVRVHPVHSTNNNEGSPSVSGPLASSASAPALNATPAAPLDTVRDGRAVRRAVGFVFTDPAAQLVMPTAAEDVALSLRAKHRKKHDRLAAAHTVLERFGIADLADRSVHSLSGGQRQLLAIASVLATDPDIVVADEPTTLLDLRNSRLIGDLLTSLPQQVIIVTHDLDLAARCDRALVVADGRIACDGEPPAAVAWYRSHA